jgi:hypothetical protein
MSRLIEWMQRRAGFQSDDARWTHAAIYAGNDLLIEANWSKKSNHSNDPRDKTIGQGVRTVRVFDYAPAAFFRLRRCNSISAEESKKIVQFARGHVGKDYDFAGAIKWLRLPLMTTLFRLTPKPRRQQLSALRGGYVCADLYAYAFAQVLNRLPDEAADNVTVPANLSRTPELTDIKLEWRRVRFP